MSEEVINAVGSVGEFFLPIVELIARNPIATLIYIIAFLILMCVYYCIKIGSSF